MQGAHRAPAATRAQGVVACECASARQARASCEPSPRSRAPRRPGFCGARAVADILGVPVVAQRLERLTGQVEEACGERGADPFADRLPEDRSLRPAIGRIERLPLDPRRWRRPAGPAPLPSVVCSCALTRRCDKPTNAENPERRCRGGGLVRCGAAPA